MLRKLGVSKQSQSAGDNSVNVQAESVQISGLNYGEAREMMLDVFKANFPELVDEAREIVKERVEGFVDNYLTELTKSAPEAFSQLRDPDVQYALLAAQREFARKGDVELGELLTSLLVDRTKNTGSDLTRIVLNESIETAPKLVREQLAILSLVFLLRYTIRLTVNNLEALREYLVQDIVPFIQDLSDRYSLYQHLEYAGCATISLGEISLPAALKAQFSGLFQNGFTVAESGLDNQALSTLRASNLLVPCLHDASKLQVNAMRADVLNQLLDEKSVAAPLREKLHTHFSSTWSDDKVQRLIIDWDPQLKTLFSVWQSSALKNITLSSVGIAIAQSHASQKTGSQFDLSIWI